MGGLPQVLVWDRQAGLHARDGRPTEEFAGFCGELKVDWRFCEPADPQAKGAVERLQGFAVTNFEPGRTFFNEVDFHDQLDGWFARVNARTHKTLRERPVDRLARELELMAPLPATRPDTDRRWVSRVPPDPHLRFDTTITPLTRTWSAGASRSASPSARCWRSRWTPARSPAATSAASPSIGRSLISRMREP